MFRSIKEWKYSMKMAAAAALAVVVACTALALSSCGRSSAERQVADDLDSLRRNAVTEEDITGFRNVLDSLGSVMGDATYAKAESDYRIFLEKVRDFDYEILAVEEDPEIEDSGERGEAVAEVTITTCDFGKAYVETWADFFEKNDRPADEPFDETGFYCALFDNLSKVEDRDYIRTVRIKVTDPDGKDNAESDIRTNPELRDALLGGMITEMKNIADAD